MISILINDGYCLHDLLSIPRWPHDDLGDINAAKNKQLATSEAFVYPIITDKKKLKID